MTKLINRPQYLNQLIQSKDVDLVKIITGIRRCGKSSLFGSIPSIFTGEKRAVFSYHPYEHGVFALSELN